MLPCMYDPRANLAKSALAVSTALADFVTWALAAVAFAVAVPRSTTALL